MSEDKTQVQNPLVPATNQREVGVSGDVSDASIQGLVEATHQDFKSPPGLEIVQPVSTPDLSGVAGTGAVQHPPKAATVKGDTITYPPGIIDLDTARKLREGRAEDSLADAARVVARQGKIRENRAA